MKGDIRREQIERKLKLEGEVEFVGLAAEFGVSEMTIRRDLEALESKGVGRRVLGGAIAVGSAGAEPPYEMRVSHASRPKLRIAEAARALITAGETLIIDSGSTAMAVANALRGHDLGLTIITPSLLVASHLHDEPNTTIYMTGGQLRPAELSLVGPTAEESFTRFNADVFIMGVAGIDARAGVTDYHYGEAHVKRAAMQSARRTIIFADAEKLGRVQLISIAELWDIDSIVTDAPADHPTLEAARKAGCRIVSVVVDPSPSQNPMAPDEEYPS